MPNVTKIPTARNASSLTSDSKAIAATMPSWCSAASRCRVPNAIVNAARISATQRAVSCITGSASTLAGMRMSGYCSMMVKLLDTAFSCSEM
jgi:hypothetical protein